LMQKRSNIFGKVLVQAVRWDNIITEPADEFILLRVTWVASVFRGSLLGSSSVTCNNTAGVARQPPHVTMEIVLEGVFYVVRPDAISRQLPVTSSQFRTRYG
jgi:hypothetical protein